MQADSNTPPLPSMQEINAAQKIYSKALQWRRKDEILERLSKIDPALEDIYTTQIKIMAINKLYGAGLNWQYMPTNADEISKLMKKAIPQRKEITEVDFVNLIVEMIKPKVKDYTFVFVSKFAHFFIDEYFPILDSFAESMVELHCGSLPWEKIKKGQENRRYQLFYDNFNKLKTGELAHIANKALDCYLWLAGQYKDWKYRAQQVESEILEIFKNPEFEPLLKELFPYQVSQIQQGRERLWILSR